MKEYKTNPETHPLSEELYEKSKNMLDNRCNTVYNTPCSTRRCDGIGRRSGLKIHRWRHRAGSSPATGTKNIPTPIWGWDVFDTGVRRTRIYSSSGSDPTAACGGVKGGERVAAVDS